MVVITGTFENDVIKLEKEVKSERPLKVEVTFLESVDAKVSGRLTMDDFSFKKSREILNKLTSSLSDELIKERREG
jgi:hemerythrin superfamily protein